MAYALDKEKIEKRLPEVFKNTQFILLNKEVNVNKFNVLSMSFFKTAELYYQVSGKISIAMTLGDGELEKVYDYTTNIKVNMDDEIVSCEKIIINELY